MALITTTQAAAILGVTDRRVRQYIADGRLRKETLGGMHLVREADLKKITKRKRGPKTMLQRVAAERAAEGNRLSRVRREIEKLEKR